jgi:AcrR family transcriptional regulator
MQKVRARRKLTREAIVNAGLVVADRDGVDALTIRSVAELVAAPAMSLYIHVSSKDELLDLMHCEISRRMYEGDEKPTWQEELSAVCHRVRRILREHPRWAALSQRPFAPMPALPARERLLQLMTDDHLALDEAFKILMTVLTAAVSYAKVELATVGADGKPLLTTRFERTRAKIEGVPEVAYTLTEAAVAKLGPFDFDESFSFMIRALIRGLTASDKR